MKRALSVCPILAALLATSAQAAAPAVPAYTHELSEKLYREGKYADAAETMCKKAIAEIEKSKGAPRPPGRWPSR